MEAHLYPQMAALEHHHWWFVARRRIINHFLQRLSLPSSAQILEAGCGTGGNLAMLARYGQVYALEFDDQARTMAQGLNIAEVRKGALPDDIPFPNQQFDLIVLCDVLEHLADDAQALAALNRYLKPGGWLFITVPALPMLWSQHDEQHHHYRRYLKAPLRHLVNAHDYQVHWCNYFNVILLPLVWASRYQQRLTGRHQDDLAMPALWLNTLLMQIFASERFLISWLPMWAGVSLILLARKE